MLMRVFRALRFSHALRFFRVVRFSCALRFFRAYEVFPCL